MVQSVPLARGEPGERMVSRGAGIDFGGSVG